MGGTLAEAGKGEKVQEKKISEDNSYFCIGCTLTNKKEQWSNNFFFFFDGLFSDIFSQVPVWWCPVVLSQVTALVL